MELGSRIMNGSENWRCHTLLIYQGQRRQNTSLYQFQYLWFISPQRKGFDKEKLYILSASIFFRSIDMNPLTPKAFLCEMSFALIDAYDMCYM